MFKHRKKTERIFVVLFFLATFAFRKQLFKLMFEIV